MRGSSGTRPRKGTPNASAIAAAARYLYLAIPGLVLAVTSASALLHRRGPWFAAALVLPPSYEHAHTSIAVCQLHSYDEYWKQTLPAAGAPPTVARALCCARSLVTSSSSSPRSSRCRCRPARRR